MAAARCGFLVPCTAKTPHGRVAHCRMAVCRMSAVAASRAALSFSRTTAVPAASKRPCASASRTTTDSFSSLTSRETNPLAAARIRSFQGSPSGVSRSMTMARVLPQEAGARLPEVMLQASSTERLRPRCPRQPHRRPGALSTLWFLPAFHMSLRPGTLPLLCSAQNWLHFISVL